TVAAAAANSRVDNKFVVVYPPDLHNERPASAPMPAAAYPPNSMIMSGHQNNHYAGAQPGTAGQTPVAVTQTDSSTDNGYNQGQHHYHNDADRRGSDGSYYSPPTQHGSSPVMPNNYVPPQSYNSQSSILTPSHYNANPAPSYQAPVYYGSQAPAP